MPDLDLDAIEKRWSGEQRMMTVTAQGFADVFALIARVRELEKQVDHCIHDAVDEQERFKALLDAVREDDLGGRATAQAIFNLEVDDD